MRGQSLVDYGIVLAFLAVAGVFLLEVARMIVGEVLDWMLTGVQ